MATSLGSTAASGPPTGRPRLILPVLWVDTTGSARCVEGGACAEIERLLGRMGIEVRWRPAGADGVVRSGEGRVVVVDRSLRQGRLRVLGSAFVSPAYPVAWVHLPGVLAALGMPAGCLCEVSPRRRSLEIAIGRVAVHELVHALAPEVPHGRGLMCQRLHRHLLEAAPIAFDAEVALGLQRGVVVAGEMAAREEATGEVAARR